MAGGARAGIRALVEVAERAPEVVMPEAAAQEAGTTAAPLPLRRQQRRALARGGGGAPWCCSCLAELGAPLTVRHSHEIATALCAS